MPNVHILPQFETPDQADGGIRRVVEAQLRYLPEFGITVVRDPAEADLCAVHGANPRLRDDVPFVAHSHGMMWSDYRWPAWAERLNAALIATMAQADAVTAPSEWVARAISRGMLIRPEVIYHGVDAELWTPEPTQGYVLWNKARMDAVSDPAPVNRLAELLPDVPFVTTFGQPGDNVHITGAMPVEAMRGLVQRAGVYLATTRETFGIGTLEAMAAGVPVVGWDIGGQREIIQDGATGYLVPEGEYEALAAAIRRALDARERLGAAARADALDRWHWRPRIEHYARLYHRIIEAARTPRPRVSVVITSYNLGTFLNAALDSVVWNGLDDEQVETIVVDDRSTDDSYATACALREFYESRGVRNIAVMQPPENLGLAGARNYGAQHAMGRYLLFLDADDALAPGALATLADALDRDPGLHIAAGGLQIMWHDTPNPWPNGTIDVRAQAAHLNQLHYAALWRRDAFVRTGGYRLRDWRAEDAAHWMRAFAGGLRAQQVTAAPTLLYRIRAESKSQLEAKTYADRDGDWTAWFPWRLGAASGQQGGMLAATGAPLRPEHAPFGLPTPEGRASWPVWHHEHPLISVVIPVGPGHDRYLIDALDSLMAQTHHSWEAIVVNDAGTPIDLPGHPWARVLETAGAQGAGAARNVGLAAARAPLVLWLDADDVLRPEALTQLLEAYGNGGASYVYCDTLVCRADGQIADAATCAWDLLPAYRNDAHDALSVAPAAEYDQALFLASGYRDGMPGRHSVTALVETQAARDVGGFDEQLTGYEDWDFYLRLATAGHCGVRVAQPLLVYRLATGQRRRAASKRQKSILKTLERRYAPIAEDPMARRSCCGGNVPTQVLAARGLLPPEELVETRDGSGTEQRMKYIGPLAGEHSITGQPSGRVYRVGNNPFNKFVNVDPRDVAHLTSLRTEWAEPLFEVIR